MSPTARAVIPIAAANSLSGGPGLWSTAEATGDSPPWTPVTVAGGAAASTGAEARAPAVSVAAAGTGHGPGKSPQLRPTSFWEPQWEVPEERVPGGGRHKRLESALEDAASRAGVRPFIASTVHPRVELALTAPRQRSPDALRGMRDAYAPTVRAAADPEIDAAEAHAGAVEHAMAAAAHRESIAALMRDRPGSLGDYEFISGAGGYAPPLSEFEYEVQVTVGSGGPDRGGGGHSPILGHAQTGAYSPDRRDSGSGGGGGGGSGDSARRDLRLHHTAATLRSGGRGGSGTGLGGGAAEASAYAERPKDELQLRAEEARDARMRRRTDLMRFAASGDQAAVERLLDQGADMFQQDERGRTALDWARLSAHGHYTAQALSKAMDDEMLLRKQQEERDSEVLRVRALVQRNIDFQELMLRAVARNDCDEIARLANSIALTPADVQGNIKLLEDLINRPTVMAEWRAQKDGTEVEVAAHRTAGDEVAFVGARQTQSPVALWPVRAPKDRSIGMPIVIADSIGPEVFALDVQTRDGWTGLTRCAVKGDVSGVRALLNNNAALEVETRLRHTAVTWAAATGSVPVMRELLSDGCDIARLTTEGKNALIHAAEKGKADMVAFLCEAVVFRAMKPPGSSLDAFAAAEKVTEQMTNLEARKTGEGDDSALSATYVPKAAVIDNLELFREVLYWRDNSGATALDWAEKRGHRDVSMILRHGEDRLRHRQIVMREAYEAAVKRPCAHKCGWWGQVARKEVHERDECPLNIIDCVMGCGEMVMRKRMKKHTETECQKRRVPCLFADIGCKQVLSVEHMDAHLKHICQFRPIECPRFCGAEIRADELYGHLEERCRLRKIHCACDLDIEAHAYAHHCQKLCAKRVVECNSIDYRVYTAEMVRLPPEYIKVKPPPTVNADMYDETGNAVGLGEGAKDFGSPPRRVKPASPRLGGSPGRVVGCHALLPFDAMQVHLSKTCPNRHIPCRFCGLPAAPLDRRYLHEARYCEERPMACRWGCGAIMPFKDLEDHEFDVCYLRMSRCLLGCDVPVRWCDLEWHCKQGLDGECVRRPVHCSYDLVGKRVRLRRVTRISTPYLGKTVVDRDSQEWKLPREAVPDAFQEDWVLPALPVLPPIPPPKGVKKVKALPNLPPWELDLYIAEQERAEAAAYKAMMEAAEDGNEADHDKLYHITLDPPTYADPPHKDVVVGTWVIGEVDLFDPDKGLHHIRIDGRPECTDVQGGFQWLDLRDRWQVEVAKKNDAFICGEIQAQELPHHLSSECLIRKTHCRFCNATLQAKYREFHETQRCDYRRIECPLKCETYGLLGKDEWRHLQDECPLRDVSCRCGTSMPLPELNRHLETSCDMRVIRCVLGCNVLIPAFDRRKHEAEDCPKRDVKCDLCSDLVWADHMRVHQATECRNRMEPCPFNCGMELAYKDLISHQQDRCSCRIMSCPNGCRARIRAEKMKEHRELDCMLRLVPCDIGCGDYIQAREKEAHEVLACRWRLEPCKWGCGVDLKPDALAVHQEETCYRRPLACPRGCGAVMWHSDLEVHLTWCLRQLACCGSVGDDFEIDALEGFVHIEGARTYLAQHLLREIPEHVSDDDTSEDGGSEVDEAYIFGTNEPVSRKLLLLADKAAAGDGGGAGDGATQGAASGTGTGAAMSMSTTAAAAAAAATANVGAGTTTDADGTLVRVNEAAMMQQVVPLERREDVSRADVEDYGSDVDEAARERREIDAEYGGSPSTVGSGSPGGGEVKAMQAEAKRKVWRRRHARKWAARVRREGEHLLSVVMAQGGSALVKAVKRDLRVAERRRKRIEKMWSQRAIAKDITGGYDAREFECVRELCDWIQVPAVPPAGLTPLKGKAATLQPVPGGVDGVVEILPVGKKAAHVAKRKSSIDKLKEKDIKRRGALSGPHFPFGDGRGKGVPADPDGVHPSIARLTADGGVLRLCPKHGDNPLVRACRFGDNKRVEVLLPVLSLPACEMETRLGTTALNTAARFNRVKIMELLVTKGCDVNRETSRGMTPLLEACRGGNMDVVRYLVSRNAAIDQASRKLKLLPVEMCRRTGGRERIKAWLEEKLAIQKEQTQLFIAVNCADSATVQRLCNGGEKYELNHRNVLKRRIAAIETLLAKFREDEEALVALVAKRKRNFEAALEDHGPGSDEYNTALIDNNGEPPAHPHYKIVVCEKQLKANKGELRVLRREIKIHDKELQEKKRALWVAKLLAHRALSGYDAVSWAAAKGEIPALNILLAHGGHVDVGDDVLVASARLIAQCYLGYRWMISHERKSIKSMIERFGRDAAFSLALKKVARERFRLRRSARVPYLEAIYNGEPEIVHFLKINGASRAATSLVVPLGPMPRPYTAATGEHNIVGNVMQAEVCDTHMGLVECAKRGGDDQGCRMLSLGKGWLPEARSRNAGMHEWAIDESKDVEYERERARDVVLAKRALRRGAEEERLLRADLIRRMEVADWEGVCRICNENGALVETETDTGHNVLTFAAEREAFVRIDFLKALKGDTYEAPEIACTDLAFYDKTGVWVGESPREPTVKEVAERGVDPHAIEAVRRGDDLFLDKDQHTLGEGISLTTTQENDAAAKAGGASDGGGGGGGGGGVDSTDSAIVVAAKAGERGDGASERKGGGGGGEAAFTTPRGVGHGGSGDSDGGKRGARVPALQLEDGKGDDGTGGGGETASQPDWFFKPPEPPMWFFDEEGKGFDKTAGTNDGYRQLYPGRRGREPTMVLVVAVLLDVREFRPNPNRETTAGHTALTRACEMGRTFVIEALLSRGANVNHATFDGTTAIMRAARRHRTDVVKMLCERGADLFMRDKSGRDALAWATRNLEIRTYLGAYRSRYLGSPTPTVGGPTRLLVCRLGCGAALETVQRDEHEANECPKRDLECPLGCGVPALWAEEMPAHLNDACPKRVLTCEFGCGQRLPFVEMGEHRASTCPVRPVICKYGCGLLRSIDRMDEHWSFTCPKRPQLCTVGCGEMVPLDAFAAHTKGSCLARTVRCRITCGAELPQGERDHHEQEVCPERTKECDWGCGKTGKAFELGEHEREMCDLTVVPCKLLCGKELRRMDLEAHWDSHCPKRFQMCPQKCGIKVQLHQMGTHVDKICARRVIACKDCGASVELVAMSEHLRVDCPFRRTPCAWGCGERVPIEGIPEHRKTECSKRRVTCTRDGCESTLEFDKLQRHLDFECRKRHMYCRFGCGEILPAVKQKSHEAKRCPLRVILCECNETFHAKDHVIHLKRCSAKALERGSDLAAVMAIKE